MITLILRPVNEIVYKTTDKRVAIRPSFNWIGEEDEYRSQT